jgi:hypothetical protein
MKECCDHREVPQTDSMNDSDTNKMESRLKKKRAESGLEGMRSPEWPRRRRPVDVRDVRR